MLKLDRVSKLYRVGTFGSKELKAVDRASFEVRDGEVVALIGESGSGKTTIGRLILRLTPISSGTITLGAVDVSTLRGRDQRDYYRSVQGVFQDPFSSYNPIFKADRVFKNIREEFYPRIAVEQWEYKINRSLEAVGLNPEHVLNKYPHQLSGGQLQRFLIARALLLDIRFLLADEIISMLDASTRIDVLNLLADLKSRGLSILFITHDLSLAHYISERSVILYRGRVVEMGNTLKIFEQPRHPYTKMLMTSVPRLDQRWEKGTGEIREKRLESHSGCVYFGRCPLASPACQQEPPTTEVGQDHFAACWAVREGR